MNHPSSALKTIGPIAAVVVIATFFLLWHRQGGATVSAFGRYQGDSNRLYPDTWQVSDYLPLPDGTRLAYDLILPAHKKTPAAEPLPVLFKYTPYMRTFRIFDQEGHNQLTAFMDLDWKARALLRIRYWLSSRGHLMGPLFRTPWLKEMVRSGYAVIIVERPGSGASFGVVQPAMSAVSREADAILSWIAVQPWCNGRIGMFGESQQAWCQFAAAASGNPHLKAIMPVSSQLELYDALEYRGGVYNKAFNAFFADVVPYLENLATPVDHDKDGQLLAQARNERHNALDGKTMVEGAQKMPFRDSRLSDGQALWTDVMSLYPFIERINCSGIPVYMTTGWYDLFTADMFFWYRNLTVPKRLTVRPADHSTVDKKGKDLDFGAETRRWFDYWLKDKDTGIMGEAPIHYYLVGTSGDGAWHLADQWPPAEVEDKEFYLSPGPSNTIVSTIDGRLTDVSPGGVDDGDLYTVDYSTSSGKTSRWVAVEEAHVYPDMSANDRKALTYTSDVLGHDLDLTGHPVLRLWLSTSAPDLDLFVYLEEILDDNRSVYVTEGTLRATHRRLAEAPFDIGDLPYHSHFECDMLPVPSDRPIELLLGLSPMAHRFHKGSRVRTTLAFADADNFDTPRIEPPPQVRVFRDQHHLSCLRITTLPTNGLEDK